MIKFDAKLLAATALAQSTESTRYYLNGVYLDGHRAVATDGHVLNIARDENAVVDEPGIYPISKKAITAAKKAKSDFLEINGTMLFVYDEDGAILHVEPCAPIDGTFPDYMRIIPSKLETDCPLPAFAAHVVNHMIATAKIVSTRSTKHFQFFGGTATGPWIVRYDDERIFSVAMPCRSEIPTNLPEWF